MRKLFLAVPFALLMLQSSTASAMGPSAAVLIGDGFKDGYNFGFGVRGGISLPMSLYVGGTFVYHLGTSVAGRGGDSTFNLFYVGPEGGYDISAGPLTVRPYLGLGYANVRASAPESCSIIGCFGGTVSEGKFTLWPGVAALFPIGSLFVGADLRYVIPVDAQSADGTNPNAFSAFATVGYSF